ncbi:MAG: cysteine desulfurase family protein [Kiritimatiellae bacterium]|nr:cysteine desulfurase family protein [Kiritimatiellia bacterium]
MRQIYLDYNASTPIAQEVAEAMSGSLKANFGNPSSSHWAGSPAKAAVTRAREQVAALLGASPEEIVFTSGGSEANNHAIKGVFFALRWRGSHIITTQIEHPAVIQPCRFLETLGAEVTYLSVDGTGTVDPDDIRKAITKQTILISVMHANNEVGTIQPIAEIARVAQEHGVLFHTDAAQTVGKIGTRVDELGVDLLSIAGHKFHAPKGVGALYIRQGVKLESLIHGAGHEAGRRAGTENVLLDVGLGAACELAQARIGRMAEVQRLRDLFWTRLAELFGNQVVLNGHPEHRLPNTLNVSFIDKVGAEILAQVPEVAASTGSACHAGSAEISPVLRAMGIPINVGMGAIRFSLGLDTTAEEIEWVVHRLAETLGRADKKSANTSEEEFLLDYCI